jgi:subtilisin family serine protease
MAKKLSKARALNAPKLHPKLRVFANGDREVNAIRAEQCSSIAVTTKKLLAEVPQMCSDLATPVARGDLPKATATPRTLKVVPRDIAASVFIHTRSSEDGRALARVPGERARRENLIAAEVPLVDLDGLAAHENVLFIEAAERLKTPHPVKISTGAAAPAREVRAVGRETLHHKGAGVLVGIIDVGGFDFTHPDFRTANGGTRFVRIWDQGGDQRPPPKAQGYGAEFSEAHLNAAIKAAPKLGVPAYEIERQSQLSPSSHATHVASIAAGTRGIAPAATLAAVLVSLPDEDYDRRRSFYDSTRIAHAVDYLLALGEELGLPVSLNVSLGTNGHAHDGSSGVSRWLDSALSRPGRTICIAAGNAGQERAETPDDLGFIMGRIHSSGRIASRGLTQDLEWIVVGNTTVDISENELEIWYGAQDRFAISVKPPGRDWIGPISPRQFIENQQLPDGSFLSIYNELYHPANGANYISVYLSPLFSDRGVVGASAGTWVVRLHGEEVRDGSFHAWIERDDARPLRQVGEKSLWNFPSFFTERSNVDNSSVSSMACGHNVISVGNLHSTRERINLSSSQGPTRDGRCKPDVAAPGSDVIAANGFTGPDDLWVAMTGTSMASPYVCGVAALMLAAQPKLTAAQVLGILQRTARPLPGADYQWRNDAGFGVIDPEACILEASQFNDRKDLTV